MPPPTFTTVSVGTAASHASPQLLQWSCAGQLLIMMRSVIYILTPALGVNFDIDSSFIGQPPGILIRDTEPHLRWFRTVIELDMSETHRWASFSMHPSTNSIGTTSFTWRDAAWSPPNISTHGCALATLSSNHELGIWTPNNNYLHGEWSKAWLIYGTLDAY
ncbi:uncharacterized protein EI90DRAFT_1404798 [Cantharellus anzutake]|uniref:uncharacterized protein n=1 Tax=Cantharellus anzutake TaxID=1750568 RepID=UPI001907EBD5|nr:uncharacterized protein EI90DRAFT_1404798 [Cantharellus anzutake]KAF8329500.1 hypothetical protein EI90DRAFT_1404798 [Cantharellus anzutake]